MSSKQLDSILSRVPSATANTTTPEVSKTTYLSVPTPSIPQPSQREPTDRIVAEIPKILKEEIRSYIKNNVRETERTVLLRALKSIGFSVEESWLVDNRSKR